MTNENEFPCTNCITLSICKAIVEERKSLVIENRRSLLYPFVPLDYKCSLFRNYLYYLRTKYSIVLTDPVLRDSEMIRFYGVYKNEETSIKTNYSM